LTGHELFKGISNKLPEEIKYQKKRDKLIDYGRELYDKLKRPLKAMDFGGDRVSRKCIERYFKTITNFLEICNIPRVARKRNMTDEELKVYLKKESTLDENNCWISKDDQISYKGKTRIRYRVTYQIFKGAIPDGLVIRHTCHNHSCINPDHLILGTQKDNINDCIKAGRRKAPVLKVKRHNARGGRIKDLNSEQLIEYVKKNCDITEKDEWLWKGSITTQGYAKIYYDNRYYMLHKLMLSFKLGKSYDEISLARHINLDGKRPKKNNVNPDHIQEGTSQDNSIDALVYSKSVKITIEQVKLIREKAKNKNFSSRGSKSAFDKQLATELNITPEMVREVRLYRRWRHI